MGNWRTVTIVGTCPPDELAAIEANVVIRDIMAADQEWLPLCYSNSLCGLGRWPAATFNVTGNLFERDFTVEDVADHLRKLAALAPSLRCKIHCGDDWESDTCIATVTLAEDGVTVGEPEVPTLHFDSSIATARLMGAMTGQKDWGA